jgi:hypothetical protein
MYRCQIWCLDFKKEYRLMVMQIRGLRQILGIKVDEKEEDGEAE